MSDYSKYLIKEIRDGSINIEYDGFLINNHPTKTLYVHCFIETNYEGGKKELFAIPPMSEKMIFSHNCGPVMENELDFEILDIYDKKPKI